MITFNGFGVPAENLEQTLSAWETKLKKIIIPEALESSFIIKEEKLLGNMPPEIKNYYYKNNKEWVFNFEKQAINDFLTYCPTRKLRKEICTHYYKSFQQTKKENFNEIVNQIIKTRHTKAEMQNYKNYAELLFTRRAEKSPQKINELLEENLKALAPNISHNINVINAYAQENLNIKKVNSWDILFVLEQIKNNLIKLNEKNFSDYYPLKYALPQILKTIENIFNIQFIAKKRAAAKIKNFNVYKDKKFLGTINFNIEKVNSKTNRCYITAERKKRSTMSLTLFGNFIKDVDRDEIFMSLQNIISIFHEMGHAVDYLLTRRINVSDELDTKELTSSLAEWYGTDEKILKEISCHYKTKKPINRQLIKKALTFYYLKQGFKTMRTLYLSMVDLNVNMPQNSIITEIIKKYSEKTNYMNCKLWKYEIYKNKDLFIESNYSYGTYYYSYLWCEIISKQIYKFLQKDRNNNKKYINEVIEQYNNRTFQRSFKVLLNKPLSYEFIKTYYNFIKLRPKH